MPLFLISMLGGLKSAGSGALAFLGKLSVWQLLLIAALLIAGVQTLRLKGEQRHSAKVEAQLSKCIAARKADRDAYAKAQTDAQAANKAQVTKVEQQYQRNSDNERQAYLSDLAKLRAMRLRSHAPAAQGSPGPTNPSAPSAAPGGTDGDGLQVPPANDVQEGAAEIELRLMHLQNWVTQQLSVDPNK